MGGPLDQGWVLGSALVCPRHGSRYELETGRPTSDPSTCPQPRYEVRIRDGVVEIRREKEPGDEVVTFQDLAHRPTSAETAQAGSARPGKKPTRYWSSTIN
jgi:hypothetical protein